ncbi:hypothetical protein ACHCAL_21160 [Providencia huaxiensis]|uniref:hypothetical protein n=2 Tax=Providencia huaxiensis TaxID=2027290 RepID=UPI0037575E55
MFEEKHFFTTYYTGGIFDLLIIPIFIGAIILTLITIRWATLNKIRKSALFLCLIILSLRLMVSATAPFNPIIPNFGDVELFSNMIVNNYFYEEQSLGIRLYYFLSYPLRIISGFNLISFLIIQTLIYYVAMLIIWRSYIDSSSYELNNSKSFIYYFILITIYPASLMYISVPLREYFLVFSLSVFMLGLTRFITGGKLVLLLVAILLFVAIRPHIIPALLAIIYFSKNYNKFSSYLIAIFIPSFLLYIFSILIYPITPEKLSEIRLNWSEVHPEDVYGIFSWSTWVDVILSVPTLVLQYITSPLPILHDRSPFTMLAGFFDFIFIISLTTIISLSLFNKQMRLAIPIHFVILIFIITILSATWEAYIGGAIRHRMTSIIPLIPISAYFLSKLTLTKKN